MSNLQPGAAVRYFMQAMGQPAPDEPVPGILGWDRWGLRMTLIEEELVELQEAYETNDHEGFLDACVDLCYVIIGAAVEAGTGQHFDEAFAAVHAANMQKLHPCDVCKGTRYEPIRGMKAYGGPLCTGCDGRGGHPKFRSDGKILKPIGWEAPDIAGIISRHAEVH